MTDNLRVRRALLSMPEDAAAYRAMLNHYASDPLGQGKPLDVSILDKVLQDLNEHPSVLPYLALLDNQPVGFATCFLGYSTFKAAPLVNIHDIAVLPDCRRRGIGTALLDAITKEASLIGCCRLTLEVRDDNPAAMALYRRNGFDVSTPGGEPVLHHLMEKPLDLPAG
jgi:ribosomal protein S18 acetylase RimI-like enzyme